MGVIRRFSTALMVPQLNKLSIHFMDGVFDGMQNGQPIQQFGSERIDGILSVTRRSQDMQESRVPIMMNMPPTHKVSDRRFRFLSRAKPLGKQCEQAKGGIAEQDET